VDAPKRERAATYALRLVPAGVIVALILAVTGCSSGDNGGIAGRNAAACGTVLDRYNTDLVASDGDGSGPTLAPSEIRSHQIEVVKNCTEDQFVALIKGYGYDYTKGADAITTHDPRQVYETFESRR